jgi:hypothetical protein
MSLMLSIRILNFPEPNLARPFKGWRDRLLPLTPRRHCVRNVADPRNSARAGRVGSTCQPCTQISSLPRFPITTSGVQLRRSSIFCVRPRYWTSCRGSKDVQIGFAQRLSEQGIDVRGRDLGGSNERDQKGQHEDEQQRPKNTVSQAVPHDVPRENPSVIDPAHQSTPSLAILVAGGKLR